MAWESAAFFSEHGLGSDGPADQLGFAVQQLITTQQELATVLDSLTDAQYRQKPVGVVPSSIGGHIRHCLDHVESLLVAARTGQLNYDHRERGTDVESCRQAALRAIERQGGQLQRLAGLSASFSVQMVALLSPASPPVVVTTSLGRELAFVLSHTVHHSALVAVMVKLLGNMVPERFGYAPATIAYLERSPCVR
ncbi:MAG: DinB family protein [Planctomycetaceae bacterium]|nr:DinB family protein [Planctomycetaceae bacterium]